jgi:hypothetical protein
MLPSTLTLTARRVTVAGLALLTVSAASAAVHECHVYGVAEFGGAGECGTSSQTHNVHEKTAEKFSDHFDDMISSGIWNSVYTRNNSSCRGTYWEDPSKQGSGDDTHSGYGADECDVLFIHTHGGHSASSDYSSLSMGNSAYDCSVRTDDDMLWNSDLDIAVVKACQSGDYGVWGDGGYRQEFTTTASTFRMWNAFHGNSSCGTHVKSYVKSYARDSDYNGVGENWIDEAYDDNSSANDDDCPCSIVMGSSSSLRDSMFEYGGWRDRKNVGDKTGSSYFYVSGCDPSSGTVLP